MLRLFIGCLAVIGLIVVLLVGGCFGLIFVAAKEVTTVPERAHRDRLEAAHGPLLAELRRRLGRPDGLAGMARDPALVAIRVHAGQGSDDHDVDLLTMRPLAWRSHTLVNRAGTGTVETGGRTIACLIYVLELPGQEYWIYLADQPVPPPAQPKPARPAVERV